MTRWIDPPTLEVLASFTDLNLPARFRDQEHVLWQILQQKLKQNGDQMVAVRFG